ncbi:MAG: fused MFS/spermidine synthase, partial [Candidatus Eremiobacteraeota bacterium]|nr:fused MFS/spermidine synthase [Candidatus Eremiobacteraeota bacterium]
IVPTFLMGMVYPLATQLYRKSIDELGRTVGTVYAATTLGSVLGAFSAGFFGIPWLGAQGVLKVAAWTSLALAGGCFWAIPGRGKFPRGVLVFGVGLACGLLPLWNQGAMSAGVGVYTGGEQSDVEFQHTPPTYYRDGLSATVAVHVGPDYQTVRVNGKIDASLQLFDKLTMYLTGYIPGLLHDDPEEVVVIGFGAGMTVEALSHFNSVERIDCVELEPAILEAGRYWKGYNGDILANPKVHASVNDGRTYILASSRQYDIIASEPSNPWIAGVGTLFTEDFYVYCRRRLKPDGIMCQWFHMYGMSEDSVALVIRTFFHVFPEGAVWRSARGDILLLGSERALNVDLERLAVRWDEEPDLRRRMLELHLYKPQTLLGHYWLERADALAFAGEGPLNTDDLPLLEYRAPLTLFEAGTIERIQARMDEHRSRLLPVTETPSLLSSAGIGWLNVRRQDLVRANLTAETAPLVWARMLEEAEPEKAQELFRSVQGEEKWVADYWLAQLLTRRGKLDDALKYYARSLRWVPEPLRLNVFLDQADCALGARQPAPALEASMQALGSAGGVEESRSYLYRGRAFYQLGRFEEALEEFEVGARLNPGGVGLHLGRAHSLINLERDADQAFRDLFALSPSFLEPYLESARYQATQGRTEAALETLKKASVQFPEEPSLIELRSRVQDGFVTKDEIFR